MAPGRWRYPWHYLFRGEYSLWWFGSNLWNGTKIWVTRPSFHAYWVRGLLPSLLKVLIGSKFDTFGQSWLQDGIFPWSRLPNFSFWAWLQNPGNPEIPGIRDFFQSRDFYSGDSRFFASRHFNPRDSGFFLISGFLLNSRDLWKIPGIRDFFGIFYLRDQDFFPWDRISPQKANSAYSF